MTRDRESLQAWYRQAMLKRIVELRDLRDRVRAGEADAFDEVRKIGQALRGSGATFGFERLTAAATVVETSTDSGVLRRLEGLVSLLGDLTRTERGGEGLGPEWLGPATGLSDPGLDLPPDVAEAWARVSDRAGLTPAEVAERVAGYLSISVANPEDRGRGALRLVPEAVVTSRRIVPMREDASTITVATADPTCLETELELQRLTGRTPELVVAPPHVVESLIEEIYGGVASAPSVQVDAVDASRAATVTVTEVEAESVPAPEPVPELAPEPVPELEPEVEPDGAAASDAGADDVPLETLPSSEGSDSQRHEADQDPARDLDRGATEVLVVDDDASARLFLRAVLEKRGWRVVEAGDGMEALDVMRSASPVGLVVADLNMPRMDGLELIWALREVHAWGHLPVIVVTGERDPVLETQLLEEGADDYLRKPVDPRLFLARVESTLRRAAL